MNYKLFVVVEKDNDGYFVYCPTIQGCYSQGSTYEEAIANIQDAIKLHLEDMQEDEISKKTITDSFSLASVEVSI